MRPCSTARAPVSRGSRPHRPRRARVPGREPKRDRANRRDEPQGIDRRAPSPEAHDVRTTVVALIALAAALLGCRWPRPDPKLPDVAPPGQGPTLRPSPTPPGEQGDVPGPPAVKP